MREHKIRFGESAWREIAKAAEREGVRPSQFVREAAIVYAVLVLRNTADRSETELMEQMRELRRLDR